MVQPICRVAGCISRQHFAWFHFPMTSLLRFCLFFFLLELACPHPCFSLTIFFSFFSFLIFCSVSLFSISFFHSISFFIGPLLCSPISSPRLRWLLGTIRTASSFRTNQTHFMVTDKEKNRQADKKMKSYDTWITNDPVKIISQRVGGCHRVRTLFSLATTHERSTTRRQRGEFDQRKLTCSTWYHCLDHRVPSARTSFIPDYTLLRFSKRRKRQ